MNIKIMTADDWEGLYIDGKLVMENHSLRVEDVLEACQVKFDSHWVDDDWMCNRGRFPEKFEDVPKDKYK